MAEMYYGRTGVWTKRLESVISRQSVLLVEETGVPGENNRPAASH